VSRGGGPGKNDHKIFASTLGKLAQASVIEGQKINNGWPPKAGIGEIWSPFFGRWIGKKLTCHSPENVF
jgi:hypothetical protein